MTITDPQPYVTDEVDGDGYRLCLGDSCERLAEVETDSVGLSIHSPPFASLFVYSPSDRDLGNSASQDEFIEHYRFIIDELLRVTKPGRLAAVHVQQLATQKWRDGQIGMVDFRGDVIRAYMAAGWIMHGEVTVWKNPQAAATRTKATSLMFVTLERDSAQVRPTFADYVLLFRKPGENVEAIKPECSREDWIEWASAIWTTPNAPTDGLPELPEDSASIVGLTPCWFDIRETKVLNAAVAREQQDERHIAPLQLDLIERCIRLWSNRGDLVLSPFGGIGSEPYMAVKLGRRAWACELKPSYWRTSIRNLRAAEAEAKAGTLFEGTP
jgi:hypothetical protein